MNTRSKRTKLWWRVTRLRMPNYFRVNFIVFILYYLIQTLTMFPCAVCQLEVSWTQQAVACDNCDVWLHKSCASLNSAEFNDIENCSWTCYCCRSVNVESFIYKAFNLNISNSFQPLAGIPGDDSVFLADVASPKNNFKPRITSSPNTGPYTGVAATS